MRRGPSFAAVVGVIALWHVAPALAQLQESLPSDSPQFEQTPPADEPQPLAAEAAPKKEKLARIWANEPALVRLARDKFGDDFTETDATFFAAVAANDWADFRPSPEAKFDPQEPSSWKDSPTLKADRIIWLCSEPAASRLVPNHGVWLRGVKVENKINLYRCTLPYSLTFYDCLLDNGINVRNAKLQELDITNCCSARIDARGVQIAENVYLLRTAVFGGLDFIEAQIAGDLDMEDGFAFHGMSTDDVAKPGVAINLYDAKIEGDVKLGGKFRAFGRVRLNGARIGRSLACAGGTFKGLGETAIDADRAQIGRNITFSNGFSAEGCVDIRRVHVGGDLDCDGAKFNGGEDAALNADLTDIGGQLYLGDGLNATGEVRFVSSVIGKDADCDNGHFLNPTGTALNFDSTVIGRSLRLGYDPASATDADTNLPASFLARGSVRMYGTHVNQDLLANGGQFDTPAGQAIVACNLKVASRVVLSGVNVKGQIDLSAADIEHELDMRGSQFDGSQAYNRIAIWANGMKVRGHVSCSQIDTPEQVWPFRVDGLMSFQFAAIDMSWNLYGAQFINAGFDALDASDCHVGGYVNLEQVTIDGRASFSRAKIDGMWILTRVIQPERMQLDMRFAHVWVIKDDRLDDWPSAGKLQLEGFVYDHFDDDSPLTVTDRLAWIRRQYAGHTPDKNKAGSSVRSASVNVSQVSGQTTITSNGEPTAKHFVRQGSAGVPMREVAKEHGQSSQIIPVEFETSPGEEPSGMAPPAGDPTEEPSGKSYPMIVTEPLAETNDANVGEPKQLDGSTVKDSQNTDTAGTNSDEDDATTPATDIVDVEIASDPAGRRYITQPYTQLASVYRAIGQDEQANAVLVARAERLGELSAPFSAQGLWYRYLGRLIGYGYEPFRAIKIGIAVVVVGTIVFAIGARRNLMAETKLAERVISQEDESGLVTTTYPRFNPFVYSLDVFLPFVDLHQICYWIPGERATKPRSRNCLMHLGPYSIKWSGVLRTYFWFQTLAGWTLCTLLAAAVTGIVES